MKRFLLYSFAALLLTGCAPRRAHAQFIGYVSPQTEQQTLATNVACTGTNQFFPIQNLGQTQHQLFISYSTVPQVSTAFLQGLDSSGNSATISDTLGGANPFFSVGSAVVVATGYYPKVQAVVNCATAGSPTFTLTYMGTSSTPQLIQGSLLANQIDKVTLNGQTAGAGASSFTSISPFGNSAGTLIFQYTGGSGPSGSQIQVRCGSSTQNIASVPLQIYTFSLSTITTVQTFTVPASSCPVYSTNYNSGGASASTISLEYVFTPSGEITIGPSGAGVPDPCASNGIAKSSAFANITTGTTTALVTPALLQVITVCQVVAQLNSTTASTILFEWGTGAACATTPTALTATYTNSTLVSESITIGGGSSTAFSTPGGAGLCAVTTVGTSPSIPVTVTYVRQ